MPRIIAGVEILSLAERFLAKPTPPDNILTNGQVKEWISKMQAFVNPEYTQQGIFTALNNAAKNIGWGMVDKVNLLLFSEGMREIELISSGTQISGDSSEN